MSACIVWQILGTCACFHSWVCLSEQEVDYLRKQQKLVGLCSPSMYSKMHHCYLLKQRASIGANANANAVILWPREAPS